MTALLLLNTLLGFIVVRGAGENFTRLREAGAYFARALDVDFIEILMALCAVAVAMIWSLLLVELWPITKIVANARREEAAWQRQRRLNHIMKERMLRRFQ